VASSDSWQQLSRQAVDRVARYLAAKHLRLLALLQQVDKGHGGLPKAKGSHDAGGSSSESDEE
jgi:hypothetical protein